MAGFGRGAAIRRSGRDGGVRSRGYSESFERFGNCAFRNDI
ncbi:hypothetical protein NB688_001488 [Xanthomonas sacchari]|uniref:Uncharacterized protein n=1 Tax=Xanthomonas sacchari TaxID=56458 RepID=A0ABT3DT03_9XANT|nr:hypothetical protein [Xanthomonas sacchari]MCW0419322.1 hypothetical protein [Xanthomonas sacchari]